MHPSLHECKPWLRMSRSFLVRLATSQNNHTFSSHESEASNDINLYANIHAYEALSGTQNKVHAPSRSKFECYKLQCERAKFVTLGIQQMKHRKVNKRPFIFPYISNLEIHLNLVL